MALTAMDTYLLQYKTTVTDILIGANVPAAVIEQIENL